MHVKRIIVAALVVGACLASSHGAAEASDVVAPSTYGFPVHLHSLIDLAPLLRGKDITNLHKTEILLYWLAEERAHPSSPSIGVGGSIIDSGYIQVQILMAFREVGDALALDAVLRDPSVGGDFKDRIRVGLGLMGDRRQTGAIIRILKQSDDPWLRAMAARALDWSGGTEAVPALKSALTDSFRVRRGTRGGMESPEEATGSYPIREEVQQTLRNLQNPKVLQMRLETSQRFTDRLVEQVKELPSYHIAPWAQAATQGALPGGGGQPG
jgi:hypothetical protein